MIASQQAAREALLWSDPEQGPDADPEGFDRAPRVLRRTERTGARSLQTTASQDQPEAMANLPTRSSDDSLRLSTPVVCQMIRHPPLQETRQSKVLKIPRALSSLLETWSNMRWGGDTRHAQLAGSSSHVRAAKVIP